MAVCIGYVRFHFDVGDSRYCVITPTKEEGRNVKAVLMRQLGDLRVNLKYD